MKETKKFFVRENKLNRGYAGDSEHDVRDDSLEELIEVLPPVEVLEQYEEMHPGFVAQLAEYLTKEQRYRHERERKLAEAAKMEAKRTARSRIALSVAAVVALVVVSPFVSGWVLDIIVLLCTLALLRPVFCGVGGAFNNWFQAKPRSKSTDKPKRNRGGRGNRSSSTSASGGNKRRGNGRSRRRIK